MSYWPDEDDRPKKEPGPFDEVFRDAKEGGLTWPVRDRYGLVEIKGPTKILGEEWYELKRQSPAAAELLLRTAERLMAAEGMDAADRPWLIVSDAPGDDAVPSSSAEARPPERDTEPPTPRRRPRRPA